MVVSIQRPAASTSSIQVPEQMNTRYPGYPIILHRILEQAYVSSKRQ
ncbi:hypothetical protein [uncultured Chitinophaga sp.]|jgi:hypothetical protein|nr:hypothetical protein [uncultured Chitinophaga sp.]